MSPDYQVDPIIPSKPALHERPQIELEQATALGKLFKILANDTRLRLLHAVIRAGELCVSDLSLAVQMKPQAVSNQLQRLVDRGILSARRQGNYMYYQVADPCVVYLLDRGLCLLEETEERQTNHARTADG